MATQQIPSERHRRTGLGANYKLLRTKPHLFMANGKWYCQDGRSSTAGDSAQECYSWFTNFWVGVDLLDLDASARSALVAACSKSTDLCKAIWYRHQSQGEALGITVMLPTPKP